VIQGLSFEQNEGLDG